MIVAVSKPIHIPGLGFMRQVFHQMNEKGFCGICGRDWLDIQACEPSICKLIEAESPKAI